MWGSNDVGGIAKAAQNVAVSETEVFPIIVILTFAVDATFVRSWYGTPTAAAIPHPVELREIFCGKMMTRPLKEVTSAQGSTPLAISSPFGMPSLLKSASASLIPGWSQEFPLQSVCSPSNCSEMPSCSSSCRIVSCALVCTVVPLLSVAASVIVYDPGVHPVAGGSNRTVSPLAESPVRVGEADQIRWLPNNCPSCASLAVPLKVRASYWSKLRPLSQVSIVTTGDFASDVTVVLPVAEDSDDRSKPSDAVTVRVPPLAVSEESNK